MILVLSGTEDGKEIVKRLYDNGYDLLTSVATEYGKAMFERMSLGEICIQGRLDADGLVSLIEDKQIDLLIDATHPYATNVSLNAIKACNEKNIRYIRFQRRKTDLPVSKFIHVVNDVDEAISKCKELGKKIMLTTGFNNIKDFVRLNGEIELVVRVLPIANHVQECVKMGIHASNIIALQGPFSFELNKALYERFKVDTIVTKDSGKQGGVIEKIDAAVKSEINVVLIKRPEIDYPCVYSLIDEIFDDLDKEFNQ
ncbi:MAG: precorrin-6A reductase [Candidatus Anammoxibacter sp.]